MIITAAIQKGGTAKSTTCAALAQAAAADGKKVLCIDLDPQGNLSFILGVKAGDPVANAFNLITGKERLSKCIVGSPQGMDVIPAAWALSTVRSTKGSARRLRDAIEPIRSLYDFIIVDVPPTGGELQYNALQAADGLIIPMQADVFNLQALYQITDAARQIQESNKDMRILGIVFTQYDGRSNLARGMRQAITDQAEALGVPTLGAIRAAVPVKEAAALQVSLFDYAPKSKPAQDYLVVYDMIMKNK